jgi:glycosyltransferase involved in cell wall biosynthesis
MFVIDDGSTDNTKQVVEQYIQKYAQKNYRLYYVYQENQGQSAAINNGLKLIHGEYLVWPDSDDFHAEPFALSELIQAFEEAPADVGVVRAFQYILDEKTLKIIGKRQLDILMATGEGGGTLFEDALFDGKINRKRAFWWTPGTFVVKTEVLFSLIPDREIFTSRYAGQNAQLLLPVLYNYKCITRGKFLFNVLKRENSHSRCKVNYEYAVFRHHAYRDVLVHTLQRMRELPEEKRNYLIQETTDFRNKDLFLSLFSIGEIAEAKKLYKQLSKKKSRWITHKIRKIYFLCCIPGGYQFYKTIRVLRRIFGK